MHTEEPAPGQKGPAVPSPLPHTNSLRRTSGKSDPSERTLFFPGAAFPTLFLGRCYGNPIWRSQFQAGLL